MKVIITTSGSGSHIMKYHHNSLTFMVEVYGGVCKKLWSHVEMAAYFVQFYHK